MKAHILIFNDTQIDRKSLQKVVDRVSAIVNWYSFFGNVMCLASEKSARALSKELREELPGCNFLIVTVDPNQKGGWMPRSVWSFLNEPQPVDA